MGDEADRQIEQGTDGQEDQYTAMRDRDPARLDIADAAECGIEPEDREDPEREREEYIDRRIEEWKAAHEKHPTPNRRLRRYWFLEGYDEGMAWAEAWCAEKYDIPTHEDFHRVLRPMPATHGLQESTYRPTYVDGLFAGYRDGCDAFMADWAKMRGSE